MIDGYSSGQGAGELGAIENIKAALGRKNINAAGQGSAAFDQEPDRTNGNGRAREAALLQGDRQAGPGTVGPAG